MKFPNLFKFMLVAFIMATCAGFTACATDLPQPKTANQGVAYAHAAYGIAAQTLANVYTNAPTCTSPVTVIPCSKPEIVARIRAADNTAYKALTVADTNITSQNWSGGTADDLLAWAKVSLAVLIAFETDVALQGTLDAAGKTTLSTNMVKAKAENDKIVVPAASLARAQARSPAQSQ